MLGRLLAKNLRNRPEEAPAGRSHRVQHHHGHGLERTAAGFEPEELCVELSSPSHPNLDRCAQ